MELAADSTRERRQLRGLLQTEASWLAVFVLLSGCHMLHSMSFESAFCGSGIGNPLLCNAGKHALELLSCNFQNRA